MDQHVNRRFQPISTQSALIRPFTLADADAVLALSNEESLVKWLPSQVYVDHAHAVSVLEFLIGKSTSPADPRLEPYVLAVEDPRTHDLIGHVGFSPLGDEVEIGFAIKESHQGRGIATEVIGAASRWCFRSYAIDRILAITSSANGAAMRALERSGFEWRGNELMDFQGTLQPVATFALARSTTPGPTQS